MRKRSQITFFIIFAVLILLITIFFFTLNNNQNSEEVIKESDLPQLTTYIESCIRDTLYDASFLIAYTGGSFNSNDIALSIKTDKDVMFSQEEFGDLISKYVKENLFFCLDFEPFIDKGFNLEIEEMEVNSVVSLSSISSNVNLPLKVLKENNIERASSFSAKIEAPLGEAINIANIIVDKHLEEYDVFVDLSHISSSIKNNMDFQVIYLRDGSIVVSLIFPYQRNLNNFIYNMRFDFYE